MHYEIKISKTLTSIIKANTLKRPNELLLKLKTEIDQKTNLNSNQKIKSVKTEIEWISYFKICIPLMVQITKFKYRLSESITNSK